MRVVSFNMNGFRRFRHATLNLDAPLVAIVGPNQAGKSSILAGLKALNDSNRIELNDLRRGMTIADDDIVLQVRYRLHAEDIGALEGVHGGRTVRFFRQSKVRSGGLSYATEPRLTRNRIVRLRTGSLLGQALNLHAVRDTDDDSEEDGEESLASVLRAVAAAIGTATEDLCQQLVCVLLKRLHLTAVGTLNRCQQLH